MDENQLNKVAITEQESDSAQNDFLFAFFPTPLGCCYGVALVQHALPKCEPFEPLDPNGPVGMYCCGSTVHDYAHI